jgi:hypothetical protein
MALCPHRGRSAHAAGGNSGGKIVFRPAPWACATQPPCPVSVPEAALCPGDLGRLWRRRVSAVVEVVAGVAGGHKAGAERDGQTAAYTFWATCVRRPYLLVIDRFWLIWRCGRAHPGYAGDPRMPLSVLLSRSFSWGLSMPGRQPGGLICDRGWRGHRRCWPIAQSIRSRPAG